MKKITLLVAALMATFFAQAQVLNYNVGDVVDDFTVTDTEGNEWNLYDITASGQYVYLDFFFDTCPPCQQTTRIFNELHDKYGCNEGDIFALSVNNGTDNDAEVIAFEAQYGGTFAHAPAVSSEGGAGAVDANIGIAAYPTYLLIGPDNTLVVGDIWPIADVSTFEDALPDGVDPEVMECMPILGVDDITSSDFSIYPNPSTGSDVNVTLRNATANADVIIYNMLGAVVYESTFAARSFTLQTNLKSGSYIVSITSDNGTTNKSLVVK